jgi:hypothetical protein
LTIKVNDIKGKFVKPALKKVKKIQSKFAKIEPKTEDKPGFGVALKSTGKDKFALDDVEKDEKKDFRDQLKKNDDE